MNRFIGPLLILLATFVAGVLLFIYDRLRNRKISRSNSSDNPSPINSHNNGVCCGMHAVCEKTSLTPLSSEIVYYDDEELDKFQHRSPDSYSPKEEEEFRNILYTMLQQDVAGWVRSLQLREIALPESIRDEVFMIVDELRTNS